MFSVKWAAELRFRGRAEGAYCLCLEGGESRGRNRKVHMTADWDGSSGYAGVTGWRRMRN